MASVDEDFYDGYQLLPEDFAAASKNGISYMNAYNRFYNHGWSKQDTINKPLQKPNLWPRYRELCRKHGVSETAFYNRVEHGMDPEIAAIHPPMKKGELQGKRVRIKITPEVIAEAVKIGVSESTLKNRVYNYKWSVERAMTTPTFTQYRRKDLEANRVRS